jgi:hypothetical protein
MKDRETESLNEKTITVNKIERQKRRKDEVLVLFRKDNARLVTEIEIATHKNLQSAENYTKNSNNMQTAKKMYIAPSLLVDAGVDEQPHTVSFTTLSGMNQRRLSILRVRYTIRITPFNIAQTIKNNQNQSVKYDDCDFKSLATKGKKKGR